MQEAHCARPAAATAAAEETKPRAARLTTPQLFIMREACQGHLSIKFSGLLFYSLLRAARRLIFLSLWDTLLTAEAAETETPATGNLV
jgi:hypothetical protein